MVHRCIKVYKRIIIVLILIISSLSSLLILTSCSDNALRFKNDGDTGNLIDEENGRYYIYCKGYLLAAAIKNEVYAKGDRGEKLYEVDGIDPSEWLSEDISAGIAFLFREQHIDEPKFEEFETEKINVTQSGEIEIQAGLITDKDEVDSIVNDYLNNKETDYPEYVTDYFNFYFESEKYKGIYYVLQYVVDEKNNTYLYDRWTGRCVSCGYKIYGGTGIGNGVDMNDIQ